MAALELVGVTVRLGGRVALDDVSLTVAEGERVALIGPNGGGKTTLLRALAGLVRLDSGTVRPAGSRMEIARQLAYVQQEEFWEFDFPVRDVVACGRFAHGGSGGTSVDAALARVGLESFADRAITSLSGGERRRVFVARALAQETSALLLDEPTTALDLKHREAVLRAAREFDGTIVMATHDLDSVRSLADRVVALRAGRIVREGTPDEVLSDASVRELFFG
jgi:ABC-type cobalamin/Fe3+-siderophores transport system ATPase subunit